MENLYQDFSKKGFSTKRFDKLIVKAFFTHIKNVFFMQKKLLNRTQLYLLIHLIAGMLIIMIVCHYKLSHY